MEFGQRLKQARLEAGMSQRQLCGDVITRNMLSQIENGAARPSMDTLRYLAGKLGKPMGYFLEEQAVLSPNQQVMAAAREVFAHDPAQAMEHLADYRSPDAIFDAEYHLLCALSTMALARQALEEGRNAYAQTLLEQTAIHGSATAYYTPEQERQRLLLCYRARPDRAQVLSRQLPDNLTEILLRAQAETDPQTQGKILDSATARDAQWYFIRGEVWFAQQNYAKALVCYEQAPKDRRTYDRLETCCRELEDYKGAYYYAVKAREL